ncbi:MAG TPA: adenylate/guanylate cyclase domain-containing protein [Bacteroidetes bacterium]|nr:adenylate/guanylate cyclase domain-containing protein [Bacteroidota bacterium]
MKQLLPLILFLFAATLCGQDEPASDRAKAAAALHGEGLALLQKESPEAFDKVLALGKFRKSMRLLDSDKNKNNVLQKNNEKQITALIGFFSGLSNSDSLLNLTRFYPDSVFRADKRYSQQFKSLITNLLFYKKRKTRNDFYEIDGLNYTSPSSTKTNLAFILDAEKYWPLEVLEFEKELKEKENDYRSIAKKKKEKLLFEQYKNELEILKYQTKTDSLNNIVQYIQQQKETAKLETKTVIQKYIAHRNIALGIIAALLLLWYFSKRKSNRQLLSMNQTVREEKQRSEELLLNILPAEVAKELKNKASARAHEYDNISVLFSDFQGFSQIAKRLSPEELVAELDYCFTAFDRIIDKYRLQKIKTIGDAYMCVGGLYTQGNTHVKRMIYAALEIQLFLDNLKKKREAEGKHFFEARIGIHTGPIVAGVVGTKKFAFDIWGDTVNVAQQMEFHSEPGKVNISGQTYELVKNILNHNRFCASSAGSPLLGLGAGEGKCTKPIMVQYNFKCIYRRKVVVKNRKAFDMYFVEEVVRNGSR